MKRKFGDAVRARTDAAMRNEALAKILCHNVACCISAWYELEIDPTNWITKRRPEDDGPVDVLKFPTR